MLEVFIVRDGEPIATIDIQSFRASREAEEAPESYKDYTVHFTVDRGSAVGAHIRRVWGFPRSEYNCLALVRQALNTLDEKELLLEPGYDIDKAEASLPPTLAGKIRGTVREIQARLGRPNSD